MSDMQEKSTTAVSDTEATSVTPRRYAKPQVIHELKLETRAGSPLGPLGRLNPSDPMGVNQNAT